MAFMIQFNFKMYIYAYVSSIFKIVEIWKNEA